jgi:peptidyl-prolyl cis-trans isomerase SurA
MKKAAIAGVLALVVVGVARAEIVEQILVKVNGEIFTKTDLEQRQIQVLRQRGQQIDLKSEAGNAELRKMLDQVTPQIMVDAVDEMLVVQRGRELGYKLSDEQFKQVLDNIKKENHIETEEQFQAALKQENMTLPDLRRSLEKQMIISRVQQNEVFGRIGVSDEEARKYYDEHKNEFTTVPTVTLREILVRVPTDPSGINVGLDEEAKQKAESIRERALKGESFEKLTDLSEAPSKANGGLIGPVSRSDLDPTFAKTLEAMKVGDISPVIRTGSGYDVVKLEAATETRVLPFEEARQQIANKVYAGKQQAEFDRYLKKLRASAIIDWKVPELKKLYDEQLARGRASAPAAAAQQ